MVDDQPPPPTLWILVLPFCYILEPLVVHASTNVPPTALGVCVQPRMPVTIVGQTRREQYGGRSGVGFLVFLQGGPLCSLIGTLLSFR